MVARDIYYDNNRALVEELAAAHGTPLYILAWDPIQTRLSSLDEALRDLPIRHLFSFKTCPVPAVARSWHRTSRGVEVVSEFELLSAIACGIPPSDIVVNGVNKQAWLTRYPLVGLRVIFDSCAEVAALAPLAAEQSWRTGIRFHPASQVDPDTGEMPDQFGMELDEARQALLLLQQYGVAPSVAHIHLRSNLRHGDLRRGFAELAEMCQRLSYFPTALDCGGGLPAPGLWPIGIDDSDRLEPTDLAEELTIVLGRLPSVEEVWLENGRFVLASAGILVVQVLGVKTHGALRLVISDGGRTNHALVSDWESHRTSLIPSRNGLPIETALCGPTCMAYDVLARRAMPNNLAVGDLVLWHDAGAYHLPWETRFSHGLAPVVYIDESNRRRLVRKRESFASYNDRWIE